MEQPPNRTLKRYIWEFLLSNLLSGPAWAGVRATIQAAFPANAQPSDAVTVSFTPEQCAELAAVHFWPKPKPELPAGSIRCEAEDQGGYPCCDKAATWRTKPESGWSGRPPFHVCEEHYEWNRFFPPTCFEPLERAG